MFSALCVFSSIIVCGNRKIENFIISGADGAAQNIPQVLFSVGGDIYEIFGVVCVWPESILLLVEKGGFLLEDWS